MSKHTDRRKKRAAASALPASGTDIHNVSEVAQEKHHKSTKCDTSNRTWGCVRAFVQLTVLLLVLTFAWIMLHRNGISDSQSVVLFCAIVSSFRFCKK